MTHDTLYTFTGYQSILAVIEGRLTLEHDTFMDVVDVMPHDIETFLYTG